MNNYYIKWQYPLFIHFKTSTLFQVGSTILLCKSSAATPTTLLLVDLQCLS